MDHTDKPLKVVSIVPVAKQFERAFKEKPLNQGWGEFRPNREK
jgi:hypothetical protein